MAQRQENRGYLLWLALGTVCMALVMAGLLALQLAQDREIRSKAEFQGDSITALTFQLEREFLRAREALERAVNHPDADTQETLVLRFDILMSRVELLRDNPSTTALMVRPEYKATLPRVEALHDRIDSLVKASAFRPQDLAPLIREFDTMGPEVQALTIASTAIVSSQLESQTATQLRQNRQIIWLTLAQLILLLVAALGLALRHRRQEQERHALELLTQELRDANLQAEQANRSKSQFLANMSHELRTPFNGMLGMLSLLEDTALNRQQTDYVATAKDSAAHLLTLLNDILDVSALEAGKMRINPTPVHLPALLMDVDALMRPLAREKGLDFVLELPPGLPHWIQADGTRIKQIVLNLLSNAIKFSSHGTVTVSVSGDAGGGLAPDAPIPLCVEVRDQGIGMDRQTQSHLFQRFSQGDNSTSRRFGGTGLGLEISRSLARLMGGDISVSSAPGAGSTFTLTLVLPRAAAPAQIETAPAAQHRAAGSQGLDILVAEDHPVNRKYMKGLLKRLGHRVRFAENGADAVAEARRIVPDLVLMDLHMPVMDGLQATRTLREGADAAASVPIVALTADAFQESRDRTLAAGMNDFLCKPVRNDQIERLLVQLFGERGATLPPPAPATMVAPTQPLPQPPVAKVARRRFRAGEVAIHLDMNLVGEVCVAVSLTGYKGLLESFFGDETGGLGKLGLPQEQLDKSELRSLAHSMKGASASLGLKAIAQAAARIEQSAETLTNEQRQGCQLEMGELVHTAHAICHRMGLVATAPPHAGAPTSPRPPVLAPA